MHVAECLVATANNGADLDLQTLEAVRLSQRDTAAYCVITAHGNTACMNSILYMYTYT